MESKYTNKWEKLGQAIFGLKIGDKFHIRDQYGKVLTYYGTNVPIKFAWTYSGLKHYHDAIGDFIKSSDEHLMKLLNEIYTIKRINS